ncbi:hypothetical protein MD484_g8986, partial [Candolleomyces efflorescens]
MPAQKSFTEATFTGLLVEADDLVAQYREFKVFRGNKEDIPGLEDVLCDGNQSIPIQKVAVLANNTIEGRLVFHVFFAYSIHRAPIAFLKYTGVDKGIRGAFAVLQLDTKRGRYKGLAVATAKYGLAAARKVAMAAEIKAPDDIHPTGRLIVPHVLEFDGAHVV